ncbi:TNF receptor-associated factor 2-like [Ruditapes philippinarum]|uniref:TNF receptor-associated factor 2-like n=1 Tax=Ruditapes philippinarum TaxID=129788 RepID=UPI00295AC7B8|nr:TNF receptor-associated factor 2-like [Ruditapes philippinarum]XP_060576762.1 TNF receptor-associated factor 2-like [Ruditapes philippinarum]XP_060576763.1 TNF receptor-associated factor 2-like [Ruditapes philippinarum]
MSNIKVLSASKGMQLNCSHCSDYLNLAVELKHGHLFCGECFLKKGNNKSFCKRCIEEGIEESEDCSKQVICKRNRGAELDLFKMPALCMKCKKKGTYGELESHKDSCPRTPCCMCVIQ